MFPCRENYSEKPTKCRLNDGKDIILLQRYWYEMKLKAVSARHPNACHFSLGSNVYKLSEEWKRVSCQMFSETIDFTSAIPDRPQNLTASPQNNDADNKLHLWHHPANLNVFLSRVLLSMGGCQPNLCVCVCSHVRVLNYIIRIRNTINQFYPVQQDPLAKP